jgi:hypothetical protein
VHDYRKIDTDATRCKALKSKAHILGRCYWRHNTSSFFCATTIVLSSHNVNVVVFNISSTFALYHHHIFPFTESTSRVASYIILVADRHEIIVCSFRGKLSIPCQQVTRVYYRDCPCLGTPCVHLASVSVFFWRVLLALPRTILDRVSFMCFISSADTPSLSIWRLHHTITSIIYIYPCWLKGKG